MTFIQPSDWEEALAAKAEYPDAIPLAGGTDLMVEMNFGRMQAPHLLDLTRVPELTEWGTDDGLLRVGALVSFARIIDELAGRLPGLAAASRTVGSPQLRNTATVGGNLGSASPAGDALPPLLAAGCLVDVASASRGHRRVRIEDFLVGPKQTTLAPDELIAGFWVNASNGPEQFAKAGTRNAMVIAICSCAVALHPASKRVGTGIGAAAPTAKHATEAETFIAAELSDRGLWETRDRLPDMVRQRFGELVAAAAEPIDDVRGSARYRAHALSVMAGRTLTWAWDDLRRT